MNGTATPGERLRERRESVGLTQPDLSRETGVAIKTLWHYENDQRTGSPKYIHVQRVLLRLRAERLAITAAQIGDVLGVSIGQAERIIGDDPNMAPTLIERGHRAIDELERRMSVQDYDEPRRRDGGT